MHALIRLHISGAKDAKKAENLEVARQKLVHAMKKGLNIYVSMQQASPPFNDWLSNDESFPALEVFTNCGASLRAKEVCVCVCVCVCWCMGECVLLLFTACMDPRSCIGTLLVKLHSDLITPHCITRKVAVV